MAARFVGDGGLRSVCAETDFRPCARTTDHGYWGLEFWRSDAEAFSRRTTQGSRLCHSKKKGRQHRGRSTLERQGGRKAECHDRRHAICFHSLALFVPQGSRLRQISDAVAGKSG